MFEGADFPFARNKATPGRRPGVKATSSVACLLIHQRGWPLGFGGSRSGLHERRQCSHDDVDVLVFEFSDDVQVGFLGGVHARMAEAFGDARDGHAGKQQQRRMRVPQAVYRDDRHPGVFAMPREYCVGR